MSARGRRKVSSRGAWLTAVVVVVIAVLWLTLRPSPPPGFDAGANLTPLEHHGRALQALLREPANRDVILRYLVTDVLGNVLLFLPLGFVSAGALGERRAALPRLSTAVGCGLVLSVAIEAVQLLVPGRATDVDDVIFNALGTLVGAALLLVGERVVAARSRARRRGKKRAGAASR
jgi:glycopeptide antibiotics resistance protein